MGAHTRTERPKSWANWNTHRAGKVARSAREFTLYSDSVVHGMARDFGPFRLMNLIAGERRETALARPVVGLRLWHASNPNPEDDDAEHGGRQCDEIAALASLLMGVRLRAGGVTREIDRENEREPLGRPTPEAEVERPVLLQGAWTEVVAHARRTLDLDELDLLDTYPTLSAAKATVLVRAARLYQEGLWLSEREPWLTWLLFVTAVETVAGVYAADAKSDPVALLRELDPKLAAVCSKYGDQCLADVAVTQAKLLGATKKFLGFLQAFLPPEPSARPRTNRLDWTWDGLKGPLRGVYQARSAYLHAGVALPWQLRMAPAPDGDAPSERPDDDDGGLPMHLHAFELIVRGALVRWWSAAAENNSSPNTAAPP